MRLSTAALLGSAGILAGVVLASRKENEPLPVAPEVDLERYQGKWFEIARLPARFERKCMGDVTAEYVLRGDGTVQVVNTCRNWGGVWKKAKGVATTRDRRGPKSKLRVRFFWPFYGDYWILQLDPGYQWALVGTPDRRYLWILSRKPELDGGIYAQLLSKARQLGFDVDKVRRTNHAIQTQ